MKMRYLQNGFAVAFIVCALIFVVSCGGGGEEETVPSSVGSISLSANPASIPANGFSTSTVTAALFDNEGSPLSAAVLVTFSTNLGTFAESGSLEYTVYTESGGNTVTASLSASGEQGTARVTATAEGTVKQINIPFTRFDNDKVVAEEFSLSANYLNISGLSHVGLEDIITAWLGNIYGNPVQAKTSVSFKTYGTGGDDLSSCCPNR